MIIHGLITKDGKFWLVEFPALDLMTQGTTRKEAIEMAVSLVVEAVGKPGFKVELMRDAKDHIVVRSDDAVSLVALMLKRQREKTGLTLREVAKRLGSNSPNAYAVYEQGYRVPSQEKLDELLRALNPDRELLLAVG